MEKRGGLFRNCIIKLFIVCLFLVLFVSFVNAYRPDKATIHNFEDTVNITGVNLTTNLEYFWRNY